MTLTANAATATDRDGDGGRERVAIRWTTRRTRALPLVVVAGIGGLLRLVNLDSLGFNSDEAVYAGQAASLAGNPIYTDAFPVFRAHPMLVQSMLSTVYGEGEHDVAGRVVIAVLGVATIFLVHLLGRDLYGRRVGLLAAALVAVMPYHVIVTRQVLLDGPMVFFSTLTLLCFARFARSQRFTWMLAAGGAMGLTVLAKESSLVLCGGIYAFLALTPSIRRPIVSSTAALALLACVFAVHPVTQALAGASSTGKNYLVWQLLRRPNHDLGFYAVTVPWVIGPLVFLLAACAFWLARRSDGAWREVLLGSWILVPIVFFELWPVKGFQYLLPIVPAVAILAARTVVALPARLSTTGALRLLPMRSVVAGLTIASLLAVAVPQVLSPGTDRFLAGTGGVPGGRETGRWIDDNVPAGATVLTLGPSMANIIGYYGHPQPPAPQPVVRADREPGPRHAAG
jgi:4-amino-4-deoxy-L-arabinose transferase-like glycosyltransferase